MKNILILGDSYAADWSVKYAAYPGWPTLVANTFNVTNMAQAGISEYKIYKQLQSVTDVTQFDAVVISHTSPYRIHTRNHPIHATDKLHKNADLMISDIGFHANKISNILNKSLHTAKNFFNYHYDPEYQEDIYQLIRTNINQNLKGTNLLTLTHRLIDPKFVTEKNVLDFSSIITQEPGKVNHLSELGNKIVYEMVCKQLTL